MSVPWPFVISRFHLGIMIKLASASISKKDRKYPVVNCCFLFQHEINLVGVMLSSCQNCFDLALENLRRVIMQDTRGDIPNSKWPVGGSSSIFSFKTTKGELCVLTSKKLFCQKTYCVIRIFHIQFKEDWWQIAVAWNI